MTRVLASLRRDLTTCLLKAPRGRRRAVGMKRLAKYALAAFFYGTGLTGWLMTRRLRASNGALILGFHGVQEGTPTLLSRGHAIGNVESLLRFLRRHLQPVPLEAIVGSLHRGESPPTGFAVTFDDGLADNALLAAPLLRAMEIPATFFIPSEFVDAPVDPWPVQVREWVYSREKTPIREWRGLWPELQVASDQDRFTACHRIKEALKREEPARRRFLEELAGGAEGIPRPPELHRVVGRSLLKNFLQPGFQVGAHSRSHPILSGLDPSQAREEIEGSRKDLEGLLGAEIRDFAYPNGRFPDFNETIRDLVAVAGYRCAVTTEPGWVIRGDDPLALRRCMPEDVPVFLAAFDLWVRVWQSRKRPADGTRPLSSRMSCLNHEPLEGTA